MKNKIDKLPSRVEIAAHMFISGWDEGVKQTLKDIKKSIKQFETGKITLNELLEKLK